jgi:hypothetical protein
MLLLLGELLLLIILNVSSRLFNRYVNRMSKCYQPRSDSLDSLTELLNSMHYEMDDNYDLADVLFDPMWSKAVVVPPSEYLTDNVPTEEVKSIDGSLLVVILS